MSRRQENRVERILKILLRKGTVSVEELVTTLESSAPSIRRDLASLESKGLLRRTHGGAALAAELLYEPYRFDAAFQTREQRFVLEKRHIGLAAAELVKENETIGFSAGTTTTWVARSLRHRKNISIITNAVNIGMELCNMPELRVHLTGGYVRWPWSFSLIGPGAITSLNNLFLDKLFLSVSGIDPVRGATTNEADEALTFGTMVRQAKQVVVVTDASKLGMVTTALICPIECVHVLVTDLSASDAAIGPFVERGIEVQRV